MEKKKIIFINNHFQYSDGTVRALINLVNSLDSDKFDITVMPVYRCDIRLAHELRSDIKLKKAFGFYFFGFDKIVRLFPARFLYKLFIKEKYDIEVAFQSGIPTFMVGNSGNGSAVHIIWMHGFEMIEKCFSKADKVICVSKANSEKCKSIMGDSVNVDYCYNIVDDKYIFDKAKESVQFPARDDSVMFVSVGRHSPEKGYIRLVHIMSELKKEGYKFKLILVGGGPESDKIRRVVEQTGMTDSIILTGAQTNPYKYVSKSDVFICSSFSEGYSVACTEAVILGIPVITTDVPGGKEIIDDCECGMLTGIDDASLKAGIKSVLDDSQIIKEWKNTLTRTSYKFSAESRRKSVTDLFDEFYKMCDK